MSESKSPDLKLSQINRLKLLAISIGAVPDSFVEGYCLYTMIGSEAELKEVLDILEKYRPELYQKFSDLIKNRRCLIDGGRVYEEVEPGVFLHRPDLEHK